MLAVVGSLCYWRGYLVGSTFCICTDHKPLEFFLVSQTLVDNNSNGQPSLQTSFLASPESIPKANIMLFQMPFLAYQHCLWPCSLFPLCSYHSSQLPRRATLLWGVPCTKLNKDMRTVLFKKTTWTVVNILRMVSNPTYRDIHSVE